MGPPRNFRGQKDATHLGARCLTEGGMEAPSSINPSLIIGAYASSFRKTSLISDKQGLPQNTVLGQGDVHPISYYSEVVEGLLQEAGNLSSITGSNGGSQACCPTGWECQSGGPIFVLGVLPVLPSELFYFAWTQWNKDWLGSTSKWEQMWLPSPALPQGGGGHWRLRSIPQAPHACPSWKKAKVMAACVWAWQTGMLWELLLDRHQPLSPAKTCFQQKTSRCLWNFLTPASKTAVTAKQDFWGSKFWIYTDLSWIPLTPSASVQPSVKGWMGIKIFPFENCHPSKSWSAFGDSEQ